MKDTTSPLGKGKVTHDNLFNIQGNFVNVVVANAVAWGIPPADVAALVAERAIYEPLYHKCQNMNSRTRADVAAHKLAAEQYLKKLRLFWNKWIEDGDMPAQEKLLLGGDLLDTEPTPSCKIELTPYVNLKPAASGVIEVRSQTEKDATRVSMLAIADGIECRYTIVPKGEMPPGEPADCKNTLNSKKASVIIYCGPGNTGETFWGFFRWVNLTNPENSGSWSKGLQIVIE
ncbi:MAG: hypothetical protein HY811_03740 [Planctomycetes bacterium]|nr:hypothetical protein [Planctomycetota bacterium]